MKHIKKFNENSNFLDNLYTGFSSRREKDVDNKQVSHLEFLNKFVDDLEKMRSEIEENGYAEEHQINYIEELYQLFGSKYKN